MKDKSIISNSKNSNSESEYKLKYNYSFSQIQNFKKDNYHQSYLNNNDMKDNKDHINLNDYSDLYVNRTEIKIFLNQIKTLLNKNYLFYKRSLKHVLFHFLTPVITILILFFNQTLLNFFIEQFEVLNPTESQLLNIPNCKESEASPSDCITIGYAILGNVTGNDLVYYDEIIKDVSLKNDLKYNLDVKRIEYDNKNNSIEEYYNYFSLPANQNKTLYSIMFCHDKMTYKNQTIDCKSEFYGDFVFYSILYNDTLSIKDFMFSFKMPFKKDNHLLKLKNDLDNSVLNIENRRKSKGFEGKDLKINVSISDFPTVKSKFLMNFEVETNQGCLYFFMNGMVCFVLCLLEIVKEKELKLRKSLIVIGLNSLPYYLSWGITNLFFSFIMSCIILVVGLVLKFPVFLRTDMSILFLIFLLFLISMQNFALFISTFIHNRNYAYSVSFGFIIIGLVLQSFITNQNVMQALFFETEDLLLPFVRTVFCLYPPFIFSCLIFLVNMKASWYFDLKIGRWIEGPGFTIEDLTVKLEGVLFDDQYKIPTPLFFIMFLFGLLVIYFILTLYFDYVIQENTGRSYSFYFFCQKSFWFSKKNKERASISSFSIENENEGNIINETLSNHIENEYKKVKSLLKTKENGLIISGLSKTYILENKKKKEALKSTYLHIPENELFCIIGHNGAGKTTLINLLTRNIIPSQGSAYIQGIDIINESAEEFIGLCPQHDILWDELTAEEHFLIYCSLRNINNVYYQEAVSYYLSEVNLLNQKDNPVENFSGGMKRRLSIMLSIVGSPSLIILDEPTTGLDPVNKRIIWKMIKNIKKNRCVILTTHAMEEAEHLSDRIGIMKEGEFQCLGTCSQLKDEYGSGYLVHIIVKNEDLDKVLIEIEKTIPKGKVIAKQGGSIIMNISNNDMIGVNIVIKLMNLKNNPGECVVPDEFEALNRLVIDCGIEYTTLEEIFIKITGKSKEEKEGDLPT